MHPFDTDCSGLVYGCFDKDGVIIPTSINIPAITTVSDGQMEAFAEHYFTDWQSDVLELTIRVKNRKGLCDFLCGRKTLAAGRFIRSCKREKEKQRRKTLKGE